MSDTTQSRKTYTVEEIGQAQLCLSWGTYSRDFLQHTVSQMLSELKEYKKREQEPEQVGGSED